MTRELSLTKQIYVQNVCEREKEREREREREREILNSEEKTKSHILQRRYLVR